MTTAIASSVTNRDLQAKIDETALQSLQQQALQFHDMHEPVSERTKKVLPDAIRACNASLAVATEAEIAIEIAELIRWARTFNIPVVNAERTAKAYIEAVKDFPIDLIRGAFRAARLGHGAGMRLPLPADIRKHIIVPWTERNKVKMGLFLMNLAPTERALPKVSAQERAAVAAEFGKLAESLRAKIPVGNRDERNHATNERMRASLADAIEAKRAALIGDDQ